MITSLGLVILPPISEKVKAKFPLWNRRLLRYLSYFLVFFLIGVISSPNDEYTNKVNESISKPDKKKNLVRLINLDKKQYDANLNLIEPDSNDITYRVLEVLKHDKNEGISKEGNLEIVYLYIEVNKLDKVSIEKLSRLLKNERCKYAFGNCLIELWTNKKAYLKYLEREKYLRTTSDRLLKEFQKTRVPYGDKYKDLVEKWDSKYYKFISDHNVSSLDFKSRFVYYPKK